jgi:hypothetical protein
MLPAMPIIDGGPPLSEGEHHRDRLRINADGVPRRLEEPVEMEVRTNEWITQAGAAQ